MVSNWRYIDTEWDKRPGEIPVRDTEFGPSKTQVAQKRANLIKMRTKSNYTFQVFKFQNNCMFNSYFKYLLGIIWRLYITDNLSYFT